MNRNASILSFILFGLLLGIQPAATAQEVAVSYQTFYDELTPYGQWVDDQEYGNVWVPNEDAGFRPYATNGHWAMTEQGNMWVSDAPYGWAAYHYGRWTYNGYYGWVWIPGYEWAPAWVSWRSGGGYYGWAPMGPGYNVGGTYSYPDNYWVFVGPQYLYQPNVYGYYQPRHVRRYIRETNYINETYADNGYHSTYYYGPRREVIENETHQPVQVYRVSDAGAPRQTNVNGGVVQIYRPAINQQTRTTARPQNAIRGSQPVGGPQQFTRRDARNEPAFRQELQSRNAPAVQSQGRQQQNNFNSREAQRAPAANPAYQQPANRPQPQHFQQTPTNRPQPQHFQQQGNQPQLNRQQPQAQPQMGRPQNQPQRMEMRPAQQRPQPAPQSKPATHESEKRGR